MKSTIIRRSSITVVTFIAIVGSTLFSAVALENLGNLDPYTRTDPPSGWTGAPGFDGGWTKVPQKGRRLSNPAGTSLVVPANGSLYIGFKNEHDEGPTKVLSVDIEADQPGDAGNFLNVGTVCGYSTTGMTGKILPRMPPSGKGNPNDGMITLNDYFSPQPKWEWIEITNSATSAKNVRVVTASSRCGVFERTTGGNGVPDSQMDFTESSFGAPDGQTDPMQITEVEVYPRNVDVDLAFAPTFNAPPHTGNWTPEFSFIDPNGDPRPQGGVRWVSDGPGLVAGEFHEFSFTMLGAADSSYFLYGFDAFAGSHQKFFIDLGDTPWYEDFETHDLDIGAAGWRGWKGWDNDPAFDAPVTDEQVLGGAHSIKIEDDADIVRVFDDANHGTWSYSAWQYIPSDFESAGQGQFAGTYFVLLNTYNDGGPYHWSVQMQFDSNDGLLKVFHGDSTNTIDVPYATDRWVKIEAIIDLEDDWTRIYYDDEFITEYSWTGGVLGNGGGLPEIQSVDLFANGSSPVYYDQLALEPLNTVTADSVNVIVGSHESGQLSDIDQSDDSHLCFLRGAAFSPTLPSIWIEFHGVLPTDSPDTLVVLLEAQVNDTGIDQEIQMFNYNTSQFESVHVQDATQNVDSVASVKLTGDITRFVEQGTGAVRTKVTYIDDGTGFFLAWRACIDQFIWQYD